MEPVREWVAWVRRQPRVVRGRVAAEAASRNLRSCRYEASAYNAAAVASSGVRTDAWADHNLSVDMGVGRVRAWQVAHPYNVVAWGHEGRGGHGDHGGREGRRVPDRDRDWRGMLVRDLEMSAEA